MFPSGNPRQVVLSRRASPGPTLLGYWGSPLNGAQVEGALLGRQAIRDQPSSSGYSHYPPIRYLLPTTRYGPETVNSGSAFFSSSTPLLVKLMLLLKFSVFSFLKPATVFRASFVS